MAEDRTLKKELESSKRASFLKYSFVIVQDQVVFFFLQSCSICQWSEYQGESGCVKSWRVGGKGMDFGGHREDKDG